MSYISRKQSVVGCPVKVILKIYSSQFSCLRAFAQEYEYQRGALPVMDGLIDRSSLLSIPPTLSLASVDKVAQAFISAAADIRASLV